MGYVWRFIFENVFSQTLFGTDGVVHVEVLNNMLQNQWKALLAYAIVGVWQVAGYYLIIYLNGLNNISEDIYEAARIDGATGWTSFEEDHTSASHAFIYDSALHVTGKQLQDA